MKKTIITWIIILAVVFTAVCTVQILRGRWILPAMVEQVVFHGYSSCDAPTPKNIELTEDEARQLVTYFSLAAYAGTVNAQGCPSDYGFTIYLSDGTIISAREANSPRIEVNPPQGDMYWLRSEKLNSFAKEVVEKYGLEVRP